MAICLEAISEKADAVYEYFIFNNHKTFKYCIFGEVHSKGQIDKNGEGHTGFFNDLS